MIKKIETQHYEIEIIDNGLKAKRIFKMKEKLAVLFLFFPTIILISLSLFCFINNGYLYAILFFIVGLVWLAIPINNIKTSKLEKENFYFLIDEKGVHKNSVGGCSFIPWPEVNSFGFANKIYYTRSSFQICLYFSKFAFEEGELRKRLYHNNLDKFSDCDSETIVSLEFIERNIDQSVIDTIYSCIIKYCSKEKENSFIYNDAIVIFPID